MLITCPYSILSFFFLMIRRPPRSTLTHSFPTRRSSDLVSAAGMAQIHRLFHRSHPVPHPRLPAGADGRGNPRRAAQGDLSDREGGAGMVSGMIRTPEGVTPVIQTVKPSKPRLSEFSVRTSADLNLDQLPHDPVPRGLLQKPT